MNRGHRTERRRLGAPSVRSALFFAACAALFAARWPLWAQEPAAEAPKPPAREAVALETSSTVVKQFDAVADHIRAAQWGQAAALIRQTVTESAAGNAAMVPLSRRRYVSAREYGNLLISAWPPEGLAVYRRMVDPQAQQWLITARTTRDDAPLLNIVHEAFNSTYGDDALYLLGERAWDSGATALARHYWLQLLPADDGETKPGQPLARLHYPDTDLPLAEIEAKIILTLLADGVIVPAARQVEAFRQRRPDATGALAGRTGKLADIMETVLAEARNWKPPVIPAKAESFAVSCSRNARLPEAVDVAAVRWTHGLPANAYAARPARPALADRGPLSYHPVIFRDVILVNDAQRIFAWNLRTGKPAWRSGDDNSGLIYPPVAQKPEEQLLQSVRGTPHYTMTVHEGYLYARSGSPLTEFSEIEEIRQLESDVICLSLEPGQGKLVWKTSARALGEGFTFEGSPVVDDQRAFVALRRSKPQTQANIACLDRRTGATIYNRRVCTSLAAGPGEANVITHQLLTLSDGKIHYCTNLGALCALNAADGHVDWIRTYASNRLTERPERSARAQDLNPCLVQQGIVVAAPHDSRHIFAQNAFTGEPLWEQELRGRIDHLVAAVGGRLILAGDRLWCLDLFTGDVLWHIGSGDPATFGYGRPIVAGEYVYWPKPEEILQVEFQTGALFRRIPLRQLYGERGGNLTIADGLLVVAQPDRIAVFGPHAGTTAPARRELSRNNAATPLR